MDSDRQKRVRYSRNISIDGFGEDGQKKLLAGSVCVIGCGALGGIAAAYLAGAGVGKITIADFDNVDLSNLQRQILFSEADCGQSKAMMLGHRLEAINSDVEVCVKNELITSRNISSLIAGHDFVIDCSDNPDTKYNIDRACAREGIAYSIGGVFALRGQLMSWKPHTMRYSDIFPPGAESGYTPCSIGGVLGPLPGIIGSMQALEAIKFITGIGQLLTDCLLIVDGRNMSFTQIKV